MNWLYYLAEANIYLGVFYLAYCLFLNRETYYQLNRAYLIVSCVVSFVLPVMQIGALKPVEAAETYTATYTIPVQTTQVAAPIAAPIVIQHHLTFRDYLWYAYLAGAVILLLVLAVKLYTLFKLMRSAQFIEQGKHKVVYLAETDVAFSFLNYLFIGTNAPGANTMIRHELVHIRQRHSADIIFIEVLKIISWFNPCIYLLQNSLKTVHEYIADEQTAAYETDALTYSSFLVNNAYGAGGSSITHSFFNYNLLKKRIIMLNQQRSGNLARLKYLVAVPICAGLLCASTLAFSKNYGWVDLAPAKVASLSADSADMVTPSGYKRGYEKLVWHFNINSISELNFYMQKDFIMDHKNLTIKGGIVVVGFNVTDDHKLADLKVVSSTNDELNSVITNSLTSFNGTINDKPGAHTFLFHISTTGHTEEADEVICRKYGYDNHYTIAIAPKITVNGGQNPPPPPTPPQKSKMPPPPRPSVFKKGYMNLAQYLYSHASYPEGANQKNISGLVILSYNIDDKGLINDVKVVQKGGNGFDEAAAKALQGYKKPIKDDVGTHTLSMIFWILSPDTHVNTSEAIRKQSGFSGEFVVVNHRFPPPIIKPDKKDANLPPPKPKVTQVMFPPPVVEHHDNRYKKITYFIDPNDYRGAAGLNHIKSYLYEAGFQMDFKEIKTNGSNQLEISLETLPGHNWHGGGSATFDLNEMKKSNYVIAVGADNTKQKIYVHSVPKQVKLPPPVVKPDTITKKVSDGFYRYIRQNIKYPAEARDNNIDGRVIVTFAVADNKITDIKILRGLSHGLNEELTRVLQNYTPNGSVQSGKYAMPVNFMIARGDDTPGTLPADKVREYKGLFNGFISLSEVVVVSYK